VGSEPGRMSRLLRYGPAEGTAEDREAAARFLAQRLEVDPARVVVCCGTQQGLLAALATCAGPEDVVLTEALTYPGFRGLAGMLRVRLHGVAHDREGLLPDALDEACRRLRPRALFCVPTLQNPTAAVMGAARRAEIAAVAERHGLPVLEDDIYGSLPIDAPPPLATLAPDRVTYLHGFSKQLAPGLRVGYLVAPDVATAERMAAQVRVTTWMAPPLAVAVATRWIQDGTADRVLTGMRRELEARMALVREILPAEGLQAPPISPHAWMSLAPDWSSAAFVARLRERGVAVVGAETFAVGSAPPGVRLCIGGPADLDTLRRGLSVIADTLRDGPAPAAPVV
jgi:DNA-binding transcriptional MocR family regulator